MVFSTGSCPGFYPVLRRVLNGQHNCATIGFYTDWNQVVPDPKKGSEWFKKLSANQVLYRCQAGSKKDFKGFYLGLMRDLKLFRVYGLKRVLRRSYPALRRVLYVHNRVLYRTKHCYARPFQTRRAHLTKFVNLCPRYNLFRSCQTATPSIQEVPHRTTADPFRHPERTWPNLSIYVLAITRLDPVRRSYVRFKRSLIEPRQIRLDTQSAF